LRTMNNGAVGVTRRATGFEGSTAARAGASNDHNLVQYGETARSSAARRCGEMAQCRGRTRSVRPPSGAWPQSEAAAEHRQRRRLREGWRENPLQSPSALLAPAHDRVFGDGYVTLANLEARSPPSREKGYERSNAQVLRSAPRFRGTAQKMPRSVPYRSLKGTRAARGLLEGPPP
jgi:hypothetical protein